ncbi:Uncharacterized protein DAT39_000082, partial [Clarias magur]
MLLLNTFIPIRECEEASLSNHLAGFLSSSSVLLYAVLQTTAFQSTPLLQHVGSCLLQASSTDGSAA